MSDKGILFSGEIMMMVAFFLMRSYYVFKPVAMFSARAS